MRVKRLEIQGFKSFKDKTVIHFDDGITGIVGPNGCGKSNIVDAFFWVMGEQSYKHMRGTGSDDLIFNGSSKFSPLGMAEATMVLETDFDGSEPPAGATTRHVPIHLQAKEVSVTRRVYRDGSGEYFVNGVQARLKDIQELFMDTGVGAKGYSVIEQGQIGRIVNSKPDERRLLIEEAAGIAKYKARKKESLRKMEAAQGNLSRLQDVIAEIERSLASLDRQAQKARLYKKYKDELVDKETTWARRKKKILAGKIAELQSLRVEAEQQLAALRAELKTAENSVEVERIAQLTDSKHAEELQARVQELQADLARQQSALELSRRRQGDLDRQLDRLSQEKADLQRDVEAGTAALVAHSESMVSLEAESESASASVQKLDESVRAARQSTEARRQELDQAKRRLISDVSEASELSSRCAVLEARVEVAKQRLAELTEQEADLRARAAESAEECSQAEKRVQDCRSRLETLGQEKRDVAALATAAESRVRELESARDRSLAEVAQLRSRLQSLEELDAAREGFADGPRALLDWARANGAEARVVADAIDVRPGFEAALEGWLETRLEVLLAKDASQALAGLADVRNQRKGRAGVFVEASVSLPAPDHSAHLREALERAGFAVEGALSEVARLRIGLGESFGTSLARLLANVWVVKDLAPLPAFLASADKTLLSESAVVALTGESFDGREGMLRGGAVSSTEAGAASVLVRRRIIAELGERVREVEASHASIETAVQEARLSLEALRAKAEAVGIEAQEAEVAGAGSQRELEQLRRAQRDMEARISTVSAENARIEAEVTRSQDERQALGDKMTSILSGREELEAQISAMDAEVAEREAQVRVADTELQERRVQAASLTERLRSLAREIENARSRVASSERRRSDIEQIVETALREREDHRGGDEGLQQDIERVTLELGALQSRLSEVRDRLERSGALLSSALEKIKELHHQGDEKATSGNQLALEIEKVSGEAAFLQQNMEEKYGPGCLDREPSVPEQQEMPAPVVTAEITAEEELALSEEVERLRERIRRLGEVNPGAVEEFEEVKKRHDHLTRERADLEQSIQNLNDAIEYINKTSEDRYRKAFESIATRFERLFPIIFGGGAASLSLVYPEGSTDILEAGVDIMAQPPGKKVSNIGLLSGGEKALTAVSLIFAIFMVKPSPFCVLDEVDAPLDDANIGKFNALLKEMAAKSQFILITHNKKTMELNDTLYGVTMEEPGVSKMVSIRLH